MDLKPFLDAASKVNSLESFLAFAMVVILGLATIYFNYLGDKKDVPKAANWALGIFAFLFLVVALAPFLAHHFQGHPNQPDVYHVRVLVLDPHGVPAAGAVIKSPALNDTSVNDKGVADIAIPRATLPADGKVTLYADLGPALHGKQEIQLANDPNLTPTLTLQAVPAGVISGIVEDTSANALGGATVGIVGGESQTTPPDGSFKLNTSAGLSEQVTLHAQKPGYKSVDQIHPAGSGAVTIVLPPAKPAPKLKPKPRR